jgi:hypothetical protein
LAVRALATDSVKLAMVLSVRTLGLPADVLRLGPRNVVTYDRKLPLAVDSKNWIFLAGYFAGGPDEEVTIYGIADRRDS